MCTARRFVFGVIAVSLTCLSACGQPKAEPSADVSTASANPGRTEQTGSAAGPPEGFFELVACDFLSGWAWDPSRADTPLTVELYDGPRLLVTLLADQFRQDLLDARKGNGRHAFTIATPRDITDGKPHEISARADRGTIALTHLAHAPHSLTCPQH